MQKVAPSVVEIDVTSKGRRPQSSSSGDPNDLLRRFFGQGRGFNVPNGGDDETAGPMRGLGSGVIVSPDGYILTNNHVVKEASNISVVLADGREMSAKVVGTDPKSDLAVVKIKADGLPALTFADSGEISVGDVVLAVGNPFGIGQTVTQASLVPKTASPMAAWTKTSSRRMQPSTPVTPAARSWIPKGASSASTARS